MFYAVKRGSLDIVKELNKRRGDLYHVDAVSYILTEILLDNTIEQLSLSYCLIHLQFIHEHYLCSSRLSSMVTILATTVLSVIIWKYFLGLMIKMSTCIVKTR